MATVQELCNSVCKELPDGWQIRIVLERDAGWVELESPSYHPIEFASNRETIEESVCDAIEFAKSSWMDEQQSRTLNNPPQDEGDILPTTP